VRTEILVVLDHVHWQVFALIVLNLWFILDSLPKRYQSFKVLNVFNIRSSISSNLVLG
jgi:hypothetical protein